MWPQSQDISNLLEARYTIKYNSNLVSTVSKLSVRFRWYQFLEENCVLIIQCFLYPQWKWTSKTHALTNHNRKILKKKKHHKSSDMYLIFKFLEILANKKLAIYKGFPLLSSWAHEQKKHYKILINGSILSPVNLYNCITISVPQLMFSSIHPPKFVQKLHETARISNKQQKVPDTNRSTYMTVFLDNCLNSEP